MHQFASVQTPSGQTVTLAMKAAVAAGPARRFIVGDPAIQLIDALAGATLQRRPAQNRLLSGVGEPTVDGSDPEWRIRPWLARR